MKQETHRHIYVCIYMYYMYVRSVCVCYSVGGCLESRVVSVVKVMPVSSRFFTAAVLRFPTTVFITRHVRSPESVDCYRSANMGLLQIRGMVYTLSVMYEHSQAPQQNTISKPIHLPSEETFRDCIDALEKPRIITCRGFPAYGKRPRLVGPHRVDRSPL